jgi:hypothetical protein
MSNKNYSQLGGATTPLAGTELVTLWQGGVTVQTPLTQLADVYVPISRTVAGHVLSADVTLVKADVGLGNVLNTNSPNTLAGYNGSGNFAGVTVGSGLSLSGGTLTASGSGGTVTTVSVATANGFGGTVSNPTTTPSISLTTTVTGLLKGNGVSVSAATPGTDYLASNQTITLSGDTTGSGSTAITTTTVKVNGVSYGSSPSTNTVPVVTGSNTVTYEAVPNAALANSSVTLNGHSLALGGSLSLDAADVGLGNVLNTGSANSLAGYDGSGDFAGVTVGSGLSLSGGTLTATSGSGTVTSITLTQPAAGLTITGSGVAITTTGTPTFALANDLAGLEGLASTGLAARTATDTWTTRTVTGTSGTISVSNGNGVSGNPTITIDATYVRQTSITTLGTIAAGTWAGTTVAVSHGGTGLATLTAHALYAGNGTSAPTAVGPSSTSGIPLVSAGSSADPAFSGTGVKIDSHYGVITDEGNSGTGTVTFDLSVSDKHKLSLTGTCTLAVSNATTGQVFQLRLAQDGTGGRTVTWFSGITWFTSTFGAPTLAASANKVTTMMFLCTGAGAYDGFLVGTSGT